MEEITWNEFSKIEMRAGTILEVIDFPEARKPAFKVRVDFGSFGIKWSSAQITGNYAAKDLVGKQILAVINFPVKKIAGFKSEFLVLGLQDSGGNIVLASADQPVPNGSLLI